MKGKGRRVASRQAEIGRKRRRQSRATADVAADGHLVAEEDAPVATAAPGAQVEPQSSAPVSPQQSPAQPSPARSSPQRNAPRNRFDRPAAYNYVASEVRRILIMSGILLAVLIALSFVI